MAPVKVFALFTPETKDVDLFFFSDHNQGLKNSGRTAQAPFSSVKTTTKQKGRLLCISNLSYRLVEGHLSSGCNQKLLMSCHDKQQTTHTTDFIREINLLSILNMQSWTYVK